MKKLLLILMFIVFAAQPCLGALDPSIDNRKTWKNAYRFTGKPKDLFTDWCEAVEDALDGTSGVGSLYFSGLTTVVGEALSDEGTLFYDTDTSVLKYLTGAGWQDIGNTTSGSTLDQAYTAGQGITVDVAAITLTQGDTAWSTLAITSTAGTTNDYDCVTITTAGTGYTGDSLYINGVSGSTDIRGDSWNMSQAGVLTFSNGETISNLTNEKILFDTGAEDLLLDFTTGTNTITLTANGSGAVVWDFGEFVTVQGVSSLIGSTAGDMTIQVTSDTAGEDLIINQAGSGEYSVIINSAGTGAAAIDLTTSTGGILLSAKDDIILTCASTTTDDNITIQQTGAFAAGVDILAAGTGTDAILLSASAGGITFTATGAASGDVVITTVDDFSLVATDDITIDGNSAGSIITIGGNNDGNVILIGVDDSAADAITIGSVKDTIIIDGIAVTVGDTTAAAATTVQSGTGDLTLTSTDDITVTADGTLALVGTEVATLTSPALTLGSITTSAATVLQSGTGNLVLTSTDEITLTVNTTTTDNIVLTNTPGTAVDAIEITATVGGIKTTSANVASTWTHTANGTDDDLTFAVAGTFLSSLVLTSAGTAEDAINITATGTSASAASILIDTADGGIVITADGGTKGDITIDAASTVSLSAGDAFIPVTTATYDHKVKYIPISAFSATEIIIGGGDSLACVGLDAGVAEVGSTEGYVATTDETDIIKFILPLPDDFIDTGTAADLVISFDIDEQAGEECNITVVIYEYDGAANTTAIVTDALVVTNNQTRAFYTLNTLSGGMGAVAELDQGDSLIFVVNGVAAADDFHLYGLRLVYRVGLQATQ